MPEKNPTKLDYIQPLEKYVLSQWIQEILSIEYLDMGSGKHWDLRIFHPFSHKYVLSTF
jgi:hypothetical protein